MKTKSITIWFIPTFKILFVLFCLIDSICGRRFAEESYYPPIGYDDGQPSFPPAKYYDKAKTALEKLEQAPHWVSTWPDPSIKLGQVSGLALDNEGRVLVFHRASNVWDASTFSDREVYNGIGDPPIPHPTILVFNETGKLVDMWGQNLFYMPHGITMDHEGNVWVTDVALHQVFKFTPDQKQKPALILGEKFVPGRDDQHFCKPSAVAVLRNGDFFVADGYCNHRIMKFAPDGTLILEWGKRVGDSPFVLNVPHALTLAEERGLVCVADRERGRVACFRSDNGTFAGSFSNWLIGTRLFSVAYSPVHGGRLYVVNGPTISGVTPVRGYVIDFTSGRLIQTFASNDAFSNPHDVIVSPDGSRVYVAELNPYKVYKFVDDSLMNVTQELKNETVHVKPTATVGKNSHHRNKAVADIYLMLSNSVVSTRTEGAEGAWSWWRGAAGGAGSAAAAALLALAALALLRARNRGRKGATRRRWEYGHGEFKLRRLLERRRFTRVHSDDSDDEPAPMLPPQPPANA